MVKTMIGFLKLIIERFEQSLIAHEAIYMSTLSLNKQRNTTLWNDIGIPTSEIAQHDLIIEGIPYSVFSKLTELAGLN